MRIIAVDSTRKFNMAPKAPSFMAETLKFSARRVVFDTGFGFRVQIDLVPRAFGARAPSARTKALNPKPKIYILTASMPRLMLIHKLPA